MTKKEKYEVHGEGPYFIFDKETQRMVSMVSFTSEAEARAFIDLLSRGSSDDD
jgi:uroporphyrinogen-III synthase